MIEQQIAVPTSSLVCCSLHRSVSLLGTCSLDLSIRRVLLYWLVLPFSVPLVSSLPWPDPARQSLASLLQGCPPASVGYVRVHREHLRCSLHSLLCSYWSRRLASAESSLAPTGAAFGFGTVGSSAYFVFRFLLHQARASRFSEELPELDWDTYITHPQAMQIQHFQSLPLMSGHRHFQECLPYLQRFFECVWKCRGLVSSSSGTHGFYCSSACIQAASEREGQHEPTRAPSLSPSLQDGTHRATDPCCFSPSVPVPVSVSVSLSVPLPLSVSRFLFYAFFFRRQRKKSHHPDEAIAPPTGPKTCHSIQLLLPGLINDLVEPTPPHCQPALPLVPRAASRFAHHSAPAVLPPSRQIYTTATRPAATPTT